jgi:predicted dehydrogenase
MSAPLRIGLVGAGSMGSLHARVVATSPTTDLVWIADPDPARRVVADRYGATWLPEPALGEVDALIIAAPTGMHHRLAVEALELGLPVLVEKPLADDLDQVIDLVNRARAGGGVMMCGLLERFNAAVRTAFEIARDPVHVTTVRHSPYAERIVTGVASDLLVHDIDLVVRLFGERPTGVHGVFGYFEPRSRRGSEDVAEATLSFGGGQVASLSVSRIAQHKVRSLTIAELGRVIDVDLLRQDVTIYRHVDEAHFDSDAGYRQQTIMEIPVVRSTGEPLALQLQHFVDLVAGRADIGAELDSILPTHEVVDEVARTAALRR